MKTNKPGMLIRNSQRTLLINLLFLVALGLSLGPWVATADAQKISDSVVRQINALEQEKDARTPTQMKLDSQLIYARSKVTIGVASAAAPDMEPDVTIQPDGRVLVDITAAVSDKLLGFITNAGGQVVNSFARYDAIRALVPLAKIEELAGRADVRFVSRAHEGTTNAGSVDGQGDTCHRAIEARSTFGVDGTGVRVGALSDSVDYLANSQALGDLGPVNVIPGQSGSGAGEGTAMLEIIHDLAPGATLYFATAFNGAASFAANIDALVANNCNIIVDDVTYLNESPFQDGQPIAQAVKRASDAGVLCFSSARNSGNKDSGTSGTWEGDFADGGAAGSPLPAGRLHNFGGGTTYNTVTAVSSARADLFWSDPLGGSGNDYDLYVLNSTGTTVMRSSTTTQSGTQDPYESVSTLNAGERIVILQKTAAAARFLHLDTGRSRLAINTDGNVRGHNAASAGNAFSVAAVDVHTTSPFPSSFVGGASNPVESFSSDGPRRLFFQPNGTAITPGNFSSTGGMVIQKPDITAADGASGSSAVPGFSPFYGTSAAAPHAAAIAALLKSYVQFLTPAQMRATLTNSALDIMSGGWDRTSGPGIAMALQALQSVSNLSYLVLTNATASDVGGGNGNGLLDPGEMIQETVVWKNLGPASATNVTATLSAGIAGITVTSPSAAYPDIPSGALGTNLTSFAYRLAKTVPCGTVLSFTNIVSASGKTFTNTFTHVVGQLVTGGPVTNNVGSTDIPKAIPDVTTIYSTNIIATVGMIDDVNVTVRLDHTYDGDLVLALQHPDSTEVVLAANRGSSGNNYGSGTCGAGEVRTTFDDQAATLISAGTAPFAGSYRPDGVLGNFNGKTVNGTWRLRVSDTAGSDTGTLYCWGVKIVSHQTSYACTLFDHAPVASNMNVTITAGASTNLTLQGSDADGDLLTFQTNSLPAHGTLTGFSPTTGAITYTAAVGYGGADSFTFIANDGYSNSALATVSFTVIAAPPVLANIESGALSYTENQAPTSLTSTLTVSDADNANMASGSVQITANYQNGQDVLSYAQVGSIVGAWNSSTGTMGLSGSDTVANYQLALRAVKYANSSDNPSTLTRTVAFKVNDATADSNTQARNITVIAVNDAPSFTKGSDQSVLACAGAQSVSGWATNISPGPPDESSQNVDFIVTNNNNGLFSVQPAVSPTGILTYTLAANSNGVATVSVKIHDSGGTANGGADTSAEQTINVTVIASPTGGADTLSTPTNTAARISSGKLKANDTGSGLQITAVTAGTGPHHGSVSLSGTNGTVTYTPETGYSGSDNFTYTLSNDQGCTAEVTVTVTVGSGSSLSLNVVYGPTKIGGEFVVRFAGIPGTEYTIEWSPNMDGPWTKKENKTAPANNDLGFGIGVFEVRETTAEPSRYYRTVWPAY